MPEIEKLRTDLIARWRAAFARIDEASAPPDGPVTTAYTRGPAFALADYTTAKFKPGARFLRTASEDGRGYTFLLDPDKRPVRVRFAHPVNRTTWRGCYRYGPHEVEHMEFCMQTSVPSLYNRLILDGDAVVAEQRLVCNSAGSDRRRTTADQILAAPDAYFIYLTRYQLIDGQTRSAQEYQEVGGEIHRPTLDYIYTAGKLDRIEQLWPSGERRVVFKPKPKPKRKR